MITYYNHTHMTAVPTGLLQDTHLSVRGQRLTAAILYALARKAFELSGTGTCSEP